MAFHPDKCPNYNDNELVVLTLQDQDYYLCLMQRYQGKLMAYIRRISGCQPEEAEDVLQEVFIKAYQNLADFDTSLKFSSWIYRITHNQVISEFRKKQARPQTYSFDQEEGLMEKIVEDAEFDLQVDRELLAKKLKNILNQLDSKYREVLILRYLEDLDYNEISDVLKKPKGTIATLLNRAKKKLKELIIKNNIKLP